MRSRPRRLVALAVAALLARPAGAVAPAAADGGLSGSWSGWAKLVNDWPGLSCRYEAGPESTAVQLELSVAEGRLRGSVAIDLPAEPGSGCPPLRKRYAIPEVTVGSDTVAFTDSGGNEWTLSVRRRGTVLQGLLAWREGGPEEPLAEGFSPPGRERPRARLDGEVRLRRPEGEGEAAPDDTPGAAPEAEPAAAPAAPPPAGAGRHASHLGIVLGANVVGLGLLYGVNKLGRGGSEGGVLTCSPRVCIVGPTINDPCFCEGNVVSGASCGTTTGGAPIGAPCDGRAVPCQSGLSCNSGTCQDRDGRCPY